jgi:Flp pilus assembly protein TadG
MRRDERGVMAIELVVLTPMLVGAIMVIAVGVRYIDARGEANDAAYAAARAASLTTNQEAAVQAGTEAAVDAGQHGQACPDPTVHIHAGDFQPGGDVRATVTCVADLTDIAGFGLPGHKTFTFTAVVPIDSHRSLP